MDLVHWTAFFLVCWIPTNIRHGPLKLTSIGIGMKIKWTAKDSERQGCEAVSLGGEDPDASNQNGVCNLKSQAISERLMTAEYLTASHVNTSRYHLVYSINRMAVGWKSSYRNKLVSARH
jgi:hypothetical protein